MTPKEKRDRLFKSSRPVLRPFQVYDGDKYHKDMGILWVAHKAQPFYSVSASNQDQFAREIENISASNELLISDDYNVEYGGIGPVGIIGYVHGWKIEPHVEFFKWATPRNILRTTVAFLQMVRHSRRIGACVVHSLGESKNLFDHVCEYGVLRYVGRVLNGDPRGDEFMYSITGRKNV
jgi:hypothetical protein